jgi:hypothetical protein
MDDRIRVSAWLDIQELAKTDPKCLLPLQRAVLQDPSKASGLAKFLTCAQALWFCAQCVARLSRNMAISLLELNTFAHCISAFFIYVFWWHKPYDVATHVYIVSTWPHVLPNHRFNISYTRSRNMAREMFSSRRWAGDSLSRSLVHGPYIPGLRGYAFSRVAIPFLTYAEKITWRCASVATASSGLIVLVTVLIGSIWSLQGTARTILPADRLLHAIAYFFGLLAIAARSFLVIESFRALPNSPTSIYEVPRWTAYIPHI